MKPFVIYTLARLGVLLAVVLVLWVSFPRIHPLVTLMAAFVVSLVLSVFLLRGLRDRAAQALADRARRRQAERERLRAALAGEDDAGGPPGDGGLDDSPGDPPAEGDGPAGRG